MQSVGVDTVLYFFAVAFAKIAILIFLYRIFSVDTKFKWSCCFVGSLVSLWTTISALITIFSCRPFMARWSFTFQQEHPEFKCISTSMIILYYGWFNTVTDYVLLVMPMPLIWKMQMAFSRKLGVVIAFATGAL